MPAQVTQSNLLMSELGAEFVKAHEAHKNVVVTPGGELPAGVRGVAQLKGCRIQRIAKGKKDEGKLMFYAYGIVVTPESHNGMRVRGKRTMITEPIYATPTRTRKTVSDHIKKVYEHLAGLGVRLKDLTPDRIEDAMKALVNPANPIFFEFHTWSGQMQTTGQYAGREPMINHQWDGRTDFKKEDAVKVEVDVNLPDVEEPLPDNGENGSEAHTEPTKPESKVESKPEQTLVTNPATKPTNNTVKEKEVAPEDMDKGWDLDSMAARADKEQDLECVNRLTEQALQMGFTQEFINKVDSWTLLVEQMKKRPPLPNNEPHKQEETAIGVGDHVRYTPIDPATKNKAANSVVVEVTKIEEKGDMVVVDLRQVENRKIWYKNINAVELEPLS